VGVSTWSAEDSFSLEAQFVFCDKGWINKNEVVLEGELDKMEKRLDTKY
jgi:hypothetical protein